MSKFEEEQCSLRLASGGRGNSLFFHDRQARRGKPRWVNLAETQGILGRGRRLVKPFSESPLATVAKEAVLLQCKLRIGEGSSAWGIEVFDALDLSQRSPIVALRPMLLP